MPRGGDCVPLQRGGGEIFARVIVSSGVVAHHDGIRARHGHAAEVADAHRPAERPYRGELAAAACTVRGRLARGRRDARRRETLCRRRRRRWTRLASCRRSARSVEGRPRRASRERAPPRDPRPNDTRRRRRGEGFLEVVFHLAGASGRVDRSFGSRGVGPRRLGEKTRPAASGRGWSCSRRARSGDGAAGRGGATTSAANAREQRLPGDESEGGRAGTASAAGDEGAPTRRCQHSRAPTPATPLACSRGRTAARPGWDA